MEITRTIDDNLTTDFLFGKRKVAGARVENHIRPASGKLRPRPVRHPGVAADFHADLHTAAIE